MTETRATCPARAAVAGNPSDGFGGAVLAVPLAQIAATATVRDAETFEIVPSGDDAFGHLPELLDHVRRYGVSGSRELVLAAILRLVEHTRLPLRPVSISVETDIPRSVGLGGSSAIVIAVVRALIAHHGAAGLPLDELSALARSVETDVLGVPAGLQDRVVQTYGFPVLMEFSPDRTREVGGFTVGTYERVVPSRPIGMLVAARLSSAESSAVPQATLHERNLRGEAAFRDAVGELAASARAAASAWRRGDIARLGEEMDRSFELRRSMLELRPEQAELVELARLAGCAANYSGSGGAISAVAEDPAALERAARLLEASDCRVFRATFH